MKWNLLLFVAAAALFFGCTTHAEKILDHMGKNLGNDPASFALKAPTPWGMVWVARANPGPGQKATIDPDGTLTVVGGVTNFSAITASPK